MRGEDLGAGDAVAVAVGCRRRAQFGGRGARFGLGHGDGDERLAGEEIGEVARFLFGARVFGEGADGGEITGLHDIGAARTDTCDGLDRQHRVHQCAALSAIGLGDGNAEKSLIGHQLCNVPRIAGRAGAGERALGQMAAGEAGDRVTEGALLFAQVEIHGRTS